MRAYAAADIAASSWAPIQALQMNGGHGSREMSELMISGYAGACVLFFPAPGLGQQQSTVRDGEEGQCRLPETSGRAASCLRQAPPVVRLRQDRRPKDNGMVETQKLSALLDITRGPDGIRVQARPSCCTRREAAQPAISPLSGRLGHRLPDL